MKISKNLSRFTVDFIWGGSMIVIALAVASVSGPVIGGIIAGLPVRLASTIAIESSRKDAAYIKKMAAGALFGFIANFSFMISLILTLERFGLYKSFIFSSALCMAIVILVSYLKKR